MKGWGDGAYTVITAITKPGGAMATRSDCWVEPSEWGPNYEIPVPYLLFEGNRRLWTKWINWCHRHKIYFLEPVFRVGEVLQLSEWGRDAQGRKPAKWHVDVEVFDSAEEAFARAREVAEKS